MIVLYSNYEAFCEGIVGRVFFLQTDPASTSRMPRGVPYRIKSIDGVRLTPPAKMQDLNLLPLLYTSQEDKCLSDSHTEIEGLEAMRRVVKRIVWTDYSFKTKDNRQSWVVVKMDKIRRVLARRES